MVKIYIISPWTFHISRMTTFIRSKAHKTIVKNMNKDILRAFVEIKNHETFATYFYSFNIYIL